MLVDAVWIKDEFITDFTIGFFDSALTEVMVSVPE